MRLTADQETQLTKLGALKAKYEQALASLNAEYEVAKEELKNPIREAVQAASDLGVPKRRIHQALGWEQIASLLHFLEVKPETLTQRFNRLTKQQEVSASNGTVTYTAVEHPLFVTDRGNLTDYRIVDRDGDEWPFIILGIANGWCDLSGGEEMFWLSDSGPELRDTIIARWPEITDSKGVPLKDAYPIVDGKILEPIREEN